MSGADQPETFVSMISETLERSRLKEVMVLSPEDLDETWKACLQELSDSCETHPMAWVKFLRDSPLQDLAQRSFIWGLDSI